MPSSGVLSNIIKELDHNFKQVETEVLGAFEELGSPTSLKLNLFLKVHDIWIY